VTDDEILAVVRESDKPYATTAMIQQATGLSDQGVRNRMEKISENGELQRGKVGQHWVYWLPNYSYAESR